MVFIGIIKLLVKVVYRLIFVYPDNYCFLQNRIGFHKENGTRIGGQINKRKLQFYSRIATIAYTCLEQLNNKKVVSERKKSMLLVCGISPIVDDLMDEKGYSSIEAQQIINKNLQRNTIEETIAIGLLNDLDEFAPDIRQSDIWRDAIAFQIKSNEQANKRLTQKELEDLTFGKGGNIVLLGMLASVPELVATEIGHAAFYHVGTVIQLVDDIFDVWKDREEGQQTLATNFTDIGELVNLFDKTVNETNRLLGQLPLPKNRIDTFLFEIKAFTSLGRVALAQLMELQKKSGGRFELNNFTRRELVTDMDIWGNRLLYLRLVLFY